MTLPETAFSACDKLQFAADEFREQAIAYVRESSGLFGKRTCLHRRVDLRVDPKADPNISRG